MNTTLNNTNTQAMTQAEAMIDASCGENALDLTAFNAAHAGKIRSAAKAAAQYKQAQRINCGFNNAIVAMMVTTAVACFGGLLTMIAR